MGVLSDGPPSTHGKSDIKSDQEDDLLEWIFTKQKDIFDEQINLDQEVLGFAQAKVVPEKEIWNMELMDYYNSIASYNKYVEAQNERAKSKE